VAGWQHDVNKTWYIVSTWTNKSSNIYVEFNYVTFRKNILEIRKLQYAWLESTTLQSHKSFTCLMTHQLTLALCTMSVELICFAPPSTALLVTISFKWRRFRKGNLNLIVGFHFKNFCLNMNLEGSRLCDVTLSYQH
jgi:hypothetical protein